MITELIQTQPEDPIPFLIDQLRGNQANTTESTDNEELQRRKSKPQSGNAYVLTIWDIVL
jgi:hypothetical protein